MTDEPRSRRLQTLAIHAGEEPDPRTQASSPNIVMSTTFVADPTHPFSAEKMHESTGFVYTRWSNPTLVQLERKLAALEGAEAALTFGSGMAAITCLFLHHLRSNDHVVMSDVTYAAASELANDLLPSLGVKVTRVNMSDLGEVEKAVTPQTKLVYAETPCNPILRLTDLEKVSEIARRNGAKFAVDSTFATPVSLCPVELGADYVVHSLTKYLGGHGDALGGALLGSQNDISALHQSIAIRAGGVLSPFNAWLIMRGMATLGIRMKAHEEGAFMVANFLENHPKVRRVIYPGLPSHPQHDLASRQMKNFSGMLTFQVENGAQAAEIFSEHLKVIHYAVSLGHHRSLVFYLPTADLLETSFRLTSQQEDSYRSFASDGIFRLSVGLEDAQDLCSDLEQALSYLP